MSTAQFINNEFARNNGSWSTTVSTYSPKPGEITRSWHVIDADDVVLGRLAVTAATLLRGKHKPTFAPHVDGGDFVVVVNASKIALTGNKRADKRYYWHTGFPGGIKHRTAGQILEGKHPERVITKAIERMLPGGPLSRKQMGNLRVYGGAEHPHAAQNPEVIDLAARNPKNTRSA